MSDIFSFLWRLGNQVQEGQSGLGQQLQNQMAQGNSLFQAGLISTAVLTGSSKLSDYEMAMIELDDKYPGISWHKPRYIEPFWLRFLRWLVSIL